MEKETLVKVKDGRTALEREAEEHTEIVELLLEKRQ